MCSVDLVEPPEKILCSPVDIVSARVIWEVADEWGSSELLLEKIDLVQEKNDARPHEPSRIDHRVEEHQTLHHPVLVAFLQKHLIVLA